MSVLLLTGPPGSGKTTALRRAAERLRGWRLGGFYTEEIRRRGERRGFRAMTFDGDSWDLARVDRPGAPRVGRYGVDLDVMETLAARLDPGRAARSRPRGGCLARRRDRQDGVPLATVRDGHAPVTRRPGAGGGHGRSARRRVRRRGQAAAGRRAAHAQPWHARRAAGGDRGMGHARAVVRTFPRERRRYFEASERTAAANSAGASCGRLWPTSAITRRS